MSLDTRRWLVLLAGILANLCQGAAYASSVFAKPMMGHLGYSDMTKWAIAFSLNLGCLPVGMLLSARLTDQQRGRLVLALGGLMFGAGMFLAGFANSLPQFYLTFGVLMGIGSGAAYGAVVSTSVRWFPDRRGMASGLAVGALGFGTVLIAPIAVRLMAGFADSNVGVLYAFKVLGIAFLVIIALASLILKNPPADYAPAGFVPKAAGNTVSRVDLHWTAMLKRGRFWLLYFMYAFGAFSGLMIISQASPIAQTMTREIKSLDSPVTMAAAASIIVLIIAVANAAGRVVWGYISDKIGRLNSLALMFVLTAVSMFLLPMFVVSKTTFIIDAIVFGACFGGYLGTFPSITADAFGAKYLTVNYGLLFSAFSVAAISGPYVAAAVLKQTGDYSTAFVIAGFLAVLGLILTQIVILTDKKKKPEAA